MGVREERVEPVGGGQRAAPGGRVEQRGLVDPRTGRVRARSQGPPLDQAVQQAVGHAVARVGHQQVCQQTDQEGRRAHHGRVARVDGEVDGGVLSRARRAPHDHVVVPEGAVLRGRVQGEHEEEQRPPHGLERVGPVARVVARGVVVDGCAVEREETLVALVLHALRRQQVSRARALLHLEPQDGSSPVRHGLQRQRVLRSLRRRDQVRRVGQGVQEAEEEDRCVEQERHRHRAAPRRERLGHERVAGHQEQRHGLPQLRAVVHPANEEEPEGERQPRVEQVLQQRARARAPAEAGPGTLRRPQGRQRPARHPQRQDRAQEAKVDGHGHDGEQQGHGLAGEQIGGQVHDVRGQDVQHAIGPARAFSLVYM